jgi:hypothetical protein
MALVIDDELGVVSAGTEISAYVCDLVMHAATAVEPLLQELES